MQNFTSLLRGLAAAALLAGSLAHAADKVVVAGWSQPITVRRSRALRRLTSSKTYGGRRRMRWKSVVMALTQAAPA